MIRGRLTCSLLGFALAACGPSIEDHIKQLESGGDDLIRARQELLLGKEKSIPHLLKALEDPRHDAVGPEIADVLVRLMSRLDDERIPVALKEHLLSNPDARVRERICLGVGLHERRDFAETLIEALLDTAGVVRGNAMRALEQLQGKLTSSQRVSLFEAARRLEQDEDRVARRAARSLMALRTEEWTRQAKSELLKGRIAAAESLYAEALAFAPRSSRANLGLGRLYFENGQRERGLGVLRESGWLLDVPQVAGRPKMDGVLDDGFWEQAARITPLLAHTRSDVAMESRHHTVIYVARTAEELYFGAYCEDAHPESLIVQGHERDHEEPSAQDLVQMFIDAKFENEEFRKLTINSVGAVADGLSKAPAWRDWDYSWNPECEAATQVGDDHWSMEYRLELGQPGLPMPDAGDIWGVAIQRNYRKHLEWSGWTLNLDTDYQAYGWFLF